MPRLPASEMKDRALLAEEIRSRGGPEDYTDSLENEWQEIDSELPPMLSSALVAMRRAREDELYKRGIVCCPPTELWPAPEQPK